MDGINTSGQNVGGVLDITQRVSDLEKRVAVLEGTAMSAAVQHIPQLGASVYLHEANVASDGRPASGYQPPKEGVIVKETDGSNIVDIRTEDEDGRGITHHNIKHASERGNGENYWEFANAEPKGA
jgi:hypothetical protein